MSHPFARSKKAKTVIYKEPIIVHSHPLQQSQSYTNKHSLIFVVAKRFRTAQRNIEWRIGIPRTKSDCPAPYRRVPMA